MFFADVDDAERRSLLAGTSRTTRAVSIVLDVVGQSVVDNVCQVIHIQATGSHIRSHQQLNGMLAELLHGQVALLLRQVAVQRLGIIAVLDELVGHLLRFNLRTAEDDGVDAWIIVHQPLQCQILVLGIHHIVDMVYVLSALVTAAHHNLLVVVQIPLGNALNILTHRG